MSARPARKSAFSEDRTINTLLHSINLPAFWYLLSLGTALALLLFTRRAAPSLLAAYMLLVLAYTVFKRTPTTEPSVNLHPFWSYAVWEKERGQVLLNVLMFVPVGLLAGAWIGKKSVLFGMGFSVVIELAQLVSCRGLCEFDDVFHNTLGALLGFCLFWLLKQLWRFLRRRRGKEHE